MALPYTVTPSTPYDPLKPQTDPNSPYASWGYTPPTSEAQFSNQNGFANNHAAVAGALSGAASGASLGTKILPGWGTAIGAGVGAIYGGIKGHQNNTKGEREDFAKSMGVPDTTSLWQRLGQVLPPDEANELKDRALNKIGKHDEAGNAQWMKDVQAALSQAQTQRPPAAAGQTASAPAAPAPAADPRRQAVLDALHGGGNYRDALVAYLGGR